MIGNKWLRLAIGSTVFGALMGIRPEFDQMWVRACIGAAAGMVLGLVLIWAMKAE